MFRLLSPWVLGLCFLSINLVFVLIAALLGWLPAILGFLHRIFRGLLIHSYRLFRYLFILLNPIAERIFGISIDFGIPRIIATIALSTLFIGLIFSLTPLDFSWWLMALAAVHGLVTGVIWADALEPGGLHMGSRLH